MPMQPDIRSERLWVEEGEQRVGPVAEVAPALNIHRTYSFAVPDELAGRIALGQRVRIPFGRSGRPVVGFVVALDERAWDSTLRPLLGLEDEETFLTPHLIALGREIAEHYACPLGLTLKAMTPASVRQARGVKTVRYVRLAQSPSIPDQSAVPRMTPQRRALLAALAEAAGPIRTDVLLKQTGVSSGVLRGLIAAGLVAVETRREMGMPDDTPTPIIEPDFSLNEEQAAALQAVNRTIDRDGFCASLLFGVSGSGKTEVYIRAMRHALAQGRQVMLLVPEIVLTTQLVQRLAARFEKVAVQHSGLTESQRSILWRRIAAGTYPVVIGTRSAVFAPCPNLGLICVDEEQEASFKNMQAPRFHVRDVAIMRAKQLGIPVILGSATPSLETWRHSGTRPDYQRLIIRRRVNRVPLPTVHIIDMRDELAEMKRNVVLSRTMERLLGETLARGEQAILLMNRRGFASRLFCPACRARLSCPRCNVGLVVHSTTGQSICHYCRTRLPTPTHCPNITCGAKLVHAGAGTQRVEDVLSKLFPAARLRRVDSDTMRHRSHYEQLVASFSRGDIDVLIGTQMIAKGLDFPLVSFVGVVHAEMAGFGADFRAHERLFQLLTQVAGRAGRADRPGRVVIQTTTPELPAFSLAAKHDYESFAAQELRVRQHVGMPPFARLARLIVAHQDERVVRSGAEALCVRVRDAMAALRMDDADVIGPTPCALSRVRGKYRYDLLIRTRQVRDLRRLMHNLMENRALRHRASIVVDVDPVELA